MADQVEEIKSKVDIAQVIGERVKLKKAGRRFVGLCPFHSEKTPSFTVSPELGIYKCFGCGAAGDVIKFLQEYDGITFVEAMEELGERVGIKFKTQSSKFKSGDDNLKLRLLEANSLAAEYYHFLLMEHKVGEIAREYLEKRGIKKRTWKEFKLGYAPEGWRNLSDYLAKKKRFKLDELEKSGLLVAKGYDRFRGRIIFPLRDGRGRVVGLAGRLIEENKKEGKYVNSPETLIYHKSKHLYGLFENKDWIRKKKRVVVVEGELDMISCWQAGVKEVVAVKGSALTEDQARLIRRYTENVILAMDADEAGEEATKRAVVVAEKEGLDLRVVEIKGGKDPDDIARERPEKWRKMVDQPSEVYDFLFDLAKKKHGLNTGIGVKRVMREVASLIGKYPNLVQQAYYVKKLARALKVREEVVEEEVKRGIKYGVSGVEYKRKDKEKSGSRKEKLLGYLLAMIIQGNLKLTEKEVYWLPESREKKILDRWVTVSGKKDLRKFGESLPAELKEGFFEAGLQELRIKNPRQRTGRQKFIIKEKKGVIEELAGMEKKQRRKKLNQELREAEGAKDEKKAEKIQKEIVSLL
jgi:DNA primase